MKKDTVKIKIKKLLWFFANPRLLLCFGLAWLITNGWAYIALGIGTLLDIVWMQTVAGAYLAILWVPVTPEKILTIIIAMFLLKKLFPNDQKTLGFLRDISEKVKFKHQERKAKKKRNREQRGTQGMILYDNYIKKKFDLTAFGIERREGRSDYFCTPKGAKIIGWTGVDGIHYCTIKSLGDVVFAVEPMGDAGRHAFPVAANFEDFLRLLMACGHEAYLEQAHAWSRERYGNFAKENPVSREAGEQIAYLQREYGLLPMEDPYAYLKEIYDNFDFSTVPYKKDYYEYIPKEAMPLPKEWKVYFSLHDRKGGERAGTELPLNKTFSWAGYEWYIPSAYICAKGLVLDMFAEADSDKVHGFLFKWVYAEEDESKLTHEQRLQIENENPLAFDWRTCVEVNETLLHEKQGRGNGWVQGYEMYESEAMRDILAHYGLSLDKCWIWRRMSFPWATKSKPDIKSLKVKLEQRPQSIFGEKFTVERTGQQVRFTHPVTKAVHLLTVTEYETDTMNFDRQFSDGHEHPTHLVKMAYTLEPDLTGRQFTVSDVRQSDMPKRVNGCNPDPDFASAIAIIGGADGPTSVIVGVPRTEKKLHMACSALTFEPQNEVEWKMTFREKTVEDIEIQIK